MPNPEYRAFGSSDMSKAATAKSGGGMMGMFSDPNFINFLAGTGARMDPEGVGGALGGATQEWVQSQQMAKAMEKQGDLMDRLLEALAGGKIGKANVGKDGSVKLEAAPQVAEPGDMGLGRSVEQNKFQTDLMPESYRKYQEEMTQGIKNLSGIFSNMGL